MTSPTAMTEQERQVLLSIQGPPCETFFTFAGIINQTGLCRSEVRTACRSLRKQGFAEFSNGLWSEDGSMVGSGYGITEAGAGELDAQGIGE